jgi:hypothetical protein
MAKGAIADGDRHKDEFYSIRRIARTPLIGPAALSVAVGVWMRASRWRTRLGEHVEEAAGAVVIEVVALMLDKPLGSLDRRLRDPLLDELRDLFTRLPLSLLFVTHDRDEAFALAERVGPGPTLSLTRQGTSVVAVSK